MCVVTRAARRQRAALVHREGLDLESRDRHARETRDTLLRRREDPPRRPGHENVHRRIFDEYVPRVIDRLRVEDRDIGRDRALDRHVLARERIGHVDRRLLRREHVGIDVGRGKERVIMGSLSSPAR